MSRLYAVSLLVLALPFVVGFALPGEVARLVDAGNALYQAGRFKEAAERYDRAASLQPDSPQVLFDRGAARYRLGDHESALTDFTQAARAAQGQLKEHAEYNAGNCLFRLQRFDEAIESYKRALTLDPTDQWAKWNLELAQRARQQQKQQQEQQKRQQEQQKQSRDEKQQQQQDQQQREQQQQKQQQQQQQQQQNPQQQQQRQENAQQQQARQQQGQQTPQQGQKQEATPLTREQAAQLLSALAREDSEIQKIIRRAPMTPERPTDKDW